MKTSLESLNLSMDMNAESSAKACACSGISVKESLSWQSIKPGFNMVLLELRKRNDIRLELQVSTRSIIFAFPLTIGLKKVLPNVSIASGKKIFLDFSFAGSVSCLMLLVADFHAFEKISGGNLDSLPLNTGQPSGESPNIFLISHPMNAFTKAVLHRTLFQIPKKFLGKLVFEHAALQLISEEIEYLLRFREQGLKDKVFLTIQDKRQLEKAKTILINQLESPPDIKTLARLVGINEHKLKTGFKQMFGEPPMAFLRGFRMKTAKEILNQKGMTVTKAAIQVGYSNPSSFAACFAKHHGINPGVFKKCN